MANFRLDYFLTNRLRILSDKTDKAEIEILEEMFAEYEANLAWKEIEKNSTSNIKTNKVKPTLSPKEIKLQKYKKSIDI